MISYEDRCVGCTSMGLHCLGDGCPNMNIKILTCDRCGEQTDEAWEVDGEHLCEDCLKASFDKVSVDND